MSKNWTSMAVEKETLESVREISEETGLMKSAIMRNAISDYKKKLKNISL